MTRWRSQSYRKGGLRRGVSPAILDAACQTADALHAVGSRLPPLFTLKHLAVESQVPFGFLRDVVKRSSDIVPYQVFRLRKGSAGHAPDRFRYICVPHPYLLRAQRWIHANILSEVKCHEASVAYHHDSNIKDAAQVHCGCRWMIKLDITNFFESILEPAVYKAFRNMGYQALIAFELARLCTRLRYRQNPRAYASAMQKHQRIDAYRMRHLGHLPQGAPTSPLLANIVVRPLDEQIAKIAQHHNLIYTRYADDITLSTDSKDFSRARALNVIHEVQAALREQGFWPNRAKTQIVPPRARKVVLGLLVDTDRPRLSREFKDTLLKHLHFLSHPNVGPTKHAEHLEFDTVLGLQHHVFGLAAFATGIERAWGIDCLERLRKVEWPTAASGFPWR